VSKAEMSARLILAVVACIATMAVAQTCPTSSIAVAYQDTTCAATASALSTACSCIGLTYSSSIGFCVGISSASCATFASCSNSAIQTLNAASAAGSTCSSLASISSMLSTLAAGGVYTGSALEVACQRTVCSFANFSTNGCINNLAGVWSVACTNPYQTVLVVTIDGFVCVTTQIAAYATGFRMDARTILGLNVTIVGVPVCGSLTIGFSVPVSANYPGLGDAINNIKNNPALLANLAAAAGVSPSSLTVTGLAVVSTPVPGSPGFVLSSARATWTAVSIVAAAFALLF